MASFIAIFISLIAVILLVVFLIKFKNLFTTDKIIEKTQKQMNRFVQDLDLTATRDIELVREQSRMLRQLMDEAERQMSNFSEATDRLRKMIAETDRACKSNEYQDRQIYFDKKNSWQHQLHGGQNSNTVNLAASRVIETYKKQAEINQRLEEEVYKAENISHSYLKEKVLEEEKVLSNHNNSSNGMADLQFRREAPLVITKVLDEKSELELEKSVPLQKSSVKTLPEKVQQLFNQGLKVEEIALELSCSITEVQFIIDTL